MAASIITGILSSHHAAAAQTRPISFEFLIIASLPPPLSTFPLPARPPASNQKVQIDQRRFTQSCSFVAAAAARTRHHPLDK
jgi:hypothetical protein